MLNALERAIFARSDVDLTIVFTDSRFFLGSSAGTGDVGRAELDFLCFSFLGFGVSAATSSAVFFGDLWISVVVWLSKVSTFRFFLGGNVTFAELVDSTFSVL